MSVGGWLFASVYDRFTAGAEAAGLSAHRARLLRDAAGRVLEIGAGTGANLRFYPEQVSALTLTEPERPMARRLERRAREEARTAEIVRALADTLPFADAQFDTVVSTLVLCTVRNQSQALQEIRRVLAPGGRLLFMEHVRADRPALAAWQDRLNWLTRIVAHGCNCNRPTLAAIQDAGFTVAALVRDEIPKAPPLVRPLVVGTAWRDGSPASPL